MQEQQTSFPRTLHMHLKMRFLKGSNAWPFLLLYLAALLKAIHVESLHGLFLLVCWQGFYLWGEKLFPKYPYSKWAAFWKTLPLNWPAFKHWPPADLIYSTLACVSFYAIVSAAYWVVCLGLPSCECISVYNYRCVCVSQCENLSLLSHMCWQSLSRAPFDIRRILGISQHTLSFWRPTHSLFNLLSWSLSSSLSGFDIKPDYPQCTWYFYQRWQQLLRQEQVPVSTKTRALIMSRTCRFLDLCVKPFWKDFEQWTCPSNVGHLELTQSWRTDP